MLTRFKTLFTSHPDSLRESYFQHLGHAMSYAGRLFAAAVCAFIHALLPFLFERTASNSIKAMYEDMTKRGATTPIEQARTYPAE
jgi:Family of unknown function (DUF6356)